MLHSFSSGSAHHLGRDRRTERNAELAGYGNGGVGHQYHHGARDGERLSRGDFGTRLRSSSPHKISSKGQIKIHVQEHVVLVHPPETKLEVLGEGIVQQAAQPREDTVMNGTLEVIMDKTRMAKSIRVELAVSCRLQLPGDTSWREKEIFNQAVEIENTPAEFTGGAGQQQGIKLEKGSQSFEFSIIVPANIATYDRHPLGRIVPTIRATVEGFPAAPSHSQNPLNNLFSGIGIGKRDRSRAESRNRGMGSRDTSRPGSRATSPTRLPRNTSANHLPRVASSNHFRQDLFDAHWASKASGTSSHAHSSPVSTPGIDGEFDHGDVALPLPSHAEIKPLKGDLVAEKVIIISANPNSDYGEGISSLTLQKSGRLAGVGDWRLSLTSDAVSGLSRPLLILTSG